VKIKFFFKKDCPKCPAAKEVVSKFNEWVESYDLDTVDGLAEGAFMQVMSTPTTIVVDEQGREIRSWRGTVPSEAELRELIFP
jgi:thioredoxin-related protein